MCIVMLVLDLNLCEAAQEKPKELASESPRFESDWASMESAWRIVIHGGGRMGHTWLLSVESWDLLGLCRWFLAPGSFQVDPLSLYGCVWMWPVRIGLVPTRQIILGSEEAWSTLMRSSSLFEFCYSWLGFVGKQGFLLPWLCSLCLKQILDEFYGSNYTHVNARTQAYCSTAAE